uniref:S1 motif domain-containing protein n=1 Tax=Alexandrium andersonii TaxID=327968 RepID=A0A7S2I1P2_9DINO|mmetsp:Transcript_77709/g.173938  ORF Transcript_77709/g.173938 Transcript_77709/m.173938 type:complete len:275 (+) Transcript_77709:67-891(+)
MAMARRHGRAKALVVRIAALTVGAAALWTASSSAICFALGAPRHHVRRRVLCVRAESLASPGELDIATAVDEADAASPTEVDAAASVEEADAPPSAEDEGASSGSIVVQKFTKGQKVRGTVTKILRSGIFVDVGASRDGWVHISKVGRGRVKRAEELVEEGQELTMWVTKPKNARLELSCRPPVRVSCFEGVPKEQWLSGTVCAVDWSGLYVTVRPPDGGTPQEGKVKRREIRRGWVENPFEEADVGEDIRVRVLSVNATSGRLALTMKGIQDS